MRDERPTRRGLVRPADGSWSAVMGIEFVRTTADEVIAEIELGPSHLQGLGLVHGGVYCGLIETVTSFGALMFARRSGRSVVGTDHSTSFVASARSGKIRGTATPIHRGRSTQLWTAVVEHEDGRVLATGRVRFLCLEPEPGAKA